MILYLIDNEKDWTICIFDDFKLFEKVKDYVNMKSFIYVMYGYNVLNEKELNIAKTLKNKEKYIEFGVIEPIEIDYDKLCVG